MIGGGEFSIKCQVQDLDRHASTEIAIAASLASMRLQTFRHENEVTQNGQIFA